MNVTFNSKGEYHNAPPGPHVEVRATLVTQDELIKLIALLSALRAFLKPPPGGTTDETQSNN